VAKSLAQLGELWPARYARQEQTEALVDDATDSPTAGTDYGRALALMQAQQYAAAADLLEAVADGEPRLPDVELNLAIAYTQLGRDVDAELAVGQVLAHMPESSVAHNLQGILNRRAGRFTQARDAYGQALRLRPDYPMAHINLGILCDIYLQNADCAMQHYEEYLSLSATEDSQVALWIADLEQRRKEQ
jgi:Flp pilus assembly protein TadD